MSRNVVFVLMLSSAGMLTDVRWAAAQAPSADAAKPAAPEAQTPSGTGSVTPGPQDEAQPQADGDGKLKSTPGAKALGMSILGNQEAPTSLVIVPWKGSELGGTPGISLMLDDSRGPVDKDVFMRALRYHQLTTDTARQDGATASGRENTAAGSSATPSMPARRR